MPDSVQETNQPAPSGQKVSAFSSQALPSQPLQGSLSPPFQSLPKGNIGKIFLLILALIVVFGLGLGTAYVFLPKRGSLKQPASPVIPTQQAATSSTQVAAPTVATGVKESVLVYVKDDNIFTYEIKTREEKQITKDGSRLIRYRQPQWLDDSTVSFVRCVYLDKELRQQYTCSLIIQPLSASDWQVLVQNTSVPNINGYHVGGELGSFAWSDDGSQVAYKISKMSQIQPEELWKKELHLLKLADKSDQILESETGPSYGRGGTLDDDSTLHFSPDGSKLLVNDTARYPVFDPNQDRGTAFVYDLKTGELIWSQPKTWTTFARWIDNNTFIAKQLPKESQENGKLIQVNISTNTVTSVLEAQSWYEFEPIGKDMVIFWILSDEKGGGVALAKLNLSSKQTIVLKSQTIAKGVFADGRILVRTMKPCSGPAGGECGMDLFNGYIEDGFGVFDVNTQELTPLAISGKIYNIDVR